MKINESSLLAKCDYFVDVQLWPFSKLDPKGWLTNFTAEEKEHAYYLLNAFLYCSDHFVDEMFVAAFQGLSRQFGRLGEPFVSVQARWRSFVDSVIITHVTGEAPSTTDSGHIFARKARQKLGISEAAILSPEITLQTLLTYGPRPVVFVDDFVGSGNQFIETWRRSMPIIGTVELSFQKFPARRGSQFFYCPLLCTEYGATRLKQECPDVHLSPSVTS